MHSQEIETVWNRCTKRIVALKVCHLVMVITCSISKPLLLELQIETNTTSYSLSKSDYFIFNMRHTESHQNFSIVYLHILMGI